MVSGVVQGSNLTPLGFADAPECGIPSRISLARLNLITSAVPIALTLLAAATIVILGIFILTAEFSDSRAALHARDDIKAAVSQALAAPSTNMVPAGLTTTESAAHALQLDRLQEHAGVNDLAWVASPNVPGHETMPVVNPNGRIVGWLSWVDQRPMMSVFYHWLPMLFGIGLCIAGLIGLVSWNARRLRREIIASEQERIRLLHEDLLTGLASDREMLLALERALVERPAAGHVAFILIDLDGFWEFNDTRGREIGDELLLACASRLAANAPKDALVARFGGDKFAVLISVQDGRHAHRIAGDLVDVVAQPYVVAGQPVQIGATGGVACAPADGLSRDEIVGHAGLALRSVKNKSRGNVGAYKNEMEIELQERRFLERELRRALVEQSFALHYQPIVSADDHRIVGVEALLRWNHPTRGFIPPMTFVPVAEQAGLMGQLGEFVLRAALKDAQRWPDVFMAINISPMQLRQSDIAKTMSSLLAETDVAASRVLLEITEGVLVDEPKKTRMRLEQLRGLGLKIALDDFGAGYSNISYLQNFPIDKLKIDRSFVAALGRSANAGVLIQAMASLGRALGLSVLVEGVETDEERKVLRLAGCDEMQGYYFARPGTWQDIDKIMKAANAQGVGLPIAQTAAPARTTERNIS